MLTKVEVNNQGFDHFTLPGKFSYKNNNLTFSVAAASFIDEKQVKYSYLLKGAGNRGWSIPSTTSNFNFLNLLPGNYILHVKADFPGGLYPSQTISYPFVILSPWWQTLWFRLSLIVVLTVLSAMFTRLYFRSKMKKHLIALEKIQAIEKERTRIATDMHDDLGAGLSRIKFLSETIKLKGARDDGITKEVEKIAAYSDEMVEKMGEIVWALNEKNDTLADLIAYTRSYAVDYLSNNNINCDVHTPTDLPSTFVDGETRRNIFLSVKEGLHNVVKHAEATSVVFTVQLTHEFQIIIHDNGKGIDWANIRKFSNGLENIRKRMHDIKGKVAFEQRNGTKIALTVPLPL